MPYVTKTREVKRTLLQRLFTRPWLKKYKTVEYQEWVASEVDISVKRPIYNLYPRASLAKSPKAIKTVSVPSDRVILESASSDDFTLGVLAGVLTDDIVRSTPVDYSPDPFISGGDGDFGGGGAGSSWDSGGSYDSSSSSDW